MTYTTLRSITIFIAATIIITTILSYWGISKSVEKRELQNFKKYVLERVERERSIFTLTEQNQAAVKEEMLSLFDEMGDIDPVKEFDRIFKRYPDGVLRMHTPAKKGDKVTTAFIDESIEINADIRRRMLVFEKLAGKYGPAWNHVFPNIYIFDAKANMEAQYWPSEAQWDYSIGPEYNMNSQEWAYISNKDYDPSREPVWTGLYWDDVAEIWMVSCATPVDIDGRHVGSIGQDIYLNQLIERSIDDHLEASYNVIFRADGRLVAHPDRMKNTQSTEGIFGIEESGDETLRRIYQLVIGNPGKNILELKEDRAYLAVAEIAEPGWYFVTVQPKSIILQTAYRSAIVILISGSVTLVLVLLILLVIMRRKIGIPLRIFTKATVRISDGEAKVRLPVERDDEFGLLARSFNRMVSRIEQLISGLEQRVHEKEVMEFEREKLLKRLKINNRDLQSIVYISSHDLRSPLVNIQGFSCELEKCCKKLDALLMDLSIDQNKKEIKDLINDDIPESLKFITSSTTKMTNLVDGLLKVSRVGTIEIKIQNVNVNAIISAVVQCMQFQINSIDAKITIDELPICCSDAECLNQVFTNLIDNALKYRDKEREMKIHISGEIKDGLAVYSVSDNGIGIAEDYYEKIFGVFHQLEPNSGIGGVGLGLAIVKRIVDRIDGSIDIESKEGVGTVFKISLPISECSGKPNYDD